ncbi:MAG: hypothetical protein IPK82_30090 [Polyangiaceae bacterium]|nr:hypothetical protein [Polyangiaceae bacterium]
MLSTLRTAQQRLVICFIFLATALTGCVESAPESSNPAADIDETADEFADEENEAEEDDSDDAEPALTPQSNCTTPECKQLGGG